MSTVVESAYRRKHGKAWGLKSVSGYSHPSYRVVVMPTLANIKRRQSEYKSWFRGKPSSFFLPREVAK